MKNKYYTPELNEFYVGFSFQYLCIDGDKKDNEDWNEFIFGEYIPYELDDEGWYGILESKIQSKEIRVKHLDREDIESLGWSFSNVNTPYFSLNGFDLVINNQWLTIYEDKGADEYSFRGTIKNKSELKKLMQMLNIE